MTEENNKSWIDRLSDALLREPQTKEQLLDILNDARERDLMDEDALNMIKAILSFSDSQVRDVMVPKTSMTVIDQDSTLDDIIATVTASGHSRFPVCGNKNDDIIGIIHAKDLLRVKLKKAKGTGLKDIIRPAVYIPESKRLDNLLTEFRHNRNHMAIVLDEYGNVGGLVTIEDVLEEIVGEIADEYDRQDKHHHIHMMENDQYEVAALTPIEEFNEVMNTKFSDEDFDTIGGIVMQKFGRLPELNESIDIDGMRFDVMDTDKRRILKLKVSKAKV